MRDKQSKRKERKLLLTGKEEIKGKEEKFMWELFLSIWHQIIEYMNEDTVVRSYYEGKEILQVKE